MSKVPVSSVIMVGLPSLWFGGRVEWSSRIVRLLMLVFPRLWSWN